MNLSFHFQFTYLSSSSRARARALQQWCKMSFIYQFSFSLIYQSILPLSNLFPRRWPALGRAARGAGRVTAAVVHTGGLLPNCRGFTATLQGVAATSFG